VGSIPPAGTRSFLSESLIQRQRGLPREIMTDRMEASLVSQEIPALVFVNRAAGGGRTNAYLPRIRKLLESLAFSAQFLEMSSASELESAARHETAQDGRLLLAMGGDGTFQALANAVLGAGVTIGIFPTGGGNDFAAALGLPNHPLCAAEQVLKGKPRYVDLVRVRTADGRTRLYAGGGGIGLDAEAARHASGVYRHFPGRFRYVGAALQALSEHVPLKIRLEFPDTDLRPMEASTLLAGVLNTPTYGAGVRLAPEAVIDDGLLHVVLIENLSTLEVLKLLPRLMSSGDLRTPRVKRWTVRSVKMSTDRHCVFHGDGEILGPAPVEIEVVPRAVRVLAPASG
jgi:diacylglycerol kinase (ATP)